MARTISRRRRRFSGLPAAAGIIIFSCLACGCLATQQDVLQLESQLDELQSTIKNMQKNQADLAVKMDNLSADLVSFSENLKDSTEPICKLSEKLDDLETKMGQKVTALGNTIKKEQEAAEIALLPSKIYHDAYINLARKNYDVAAQGFQLYLEKYPDGEMVENSYYNLGEAFSAQGKWQDSALAYANILDKFRNSGQTPVVRLKYAAALLKTPGNHKDEAERYLQSIINDFPNTPQAKLAEEQLESLTPKPQKNKKQAKPGKTTPKSGQSYSSPE